MIRHDIGVLVAPPGAGKTVMGCALIAHHPVPTLILVHRQPLAVQWKEQLHTFLGLDRKEIGSFTGTKKKHSGIVDIAMLQSLARSQDLSDIRMRYGQVINIVRMDGDLGAKERREALQSIRGNVDSKHAVCILATASLIGEGFDLPELDTLIIASSLSFKGRLVQYAGRLHRLIEGKQSVLIHDYLDSFSPMMLKMYKNRLKAYKDMGYEVEFHANHT